MRHWLYFGCVLVAGCKPEAQGGTGAPATSVVATSSAAPSATALADVAPRTLARKQTPEARLAADQSQCEKGAASACRKLADRHRGYGHVAGCGVARERPKPRRAVVASDAEGDARALEKWLRRACELGDREACFQARTSPLSATVWAQDRDACLRSKGDECPLVLWQDELHPEFKALLDGERERLFGTSYSYEYLAPNLYRRDKHDGPGAGDVVPPRYAELAERIWKVSLEADDVFMMLDKDGFTPEALAPLKKKAADDLIAACLDGDCTCAEAARYVEPSDPRRLELAQLGCDDGDPDGCYLVGLAREAAKEQRAADALFDLACPSVLAVDGRPEIYSKLACDHLAARYEEATLVPKDPERAYYYASFACPRGGFERDHAPCLRAGRYEKIGFGTLIQGDFGFGTYLGPVGLPVLHTECQRPSVREQCKREKLFPL